MINHQAPIDLEGLTEFLALVDFWGLYADNDRQIETRRKHYKENIHDWFPDQTKWLCAGTVDRRGKDWYREVAAAIIAGFAAAKKDE